MEQIRDRGNSERKAKQIQTVIAGLVRTEPFVTELEYVTPVIERPDAAQLGRTALTEMGDC